MQHVEITKKCLGKYFNWHASRLVFAATFITALFSARSVCLSKVAIKMHGDAKTDSKCKRIHRFLAKFNLSYSDIAQAVMQICGFDQDKVIIAIDRTNWKFGLLDINILTLAVVADGTAIPILWTFLSKKGNSNTKERIYLLNKFISIFGKNKIECIVADREFVGTDWFLYLTDVQNIRIRIRIKDNYKINKLNGDSSYVKNFFRNISINQKKVLPQKRNLWGLYIYIIGTKSCRGELVIIVTNEAPDNALEDYSKRWGIETMFKALKSGGFDFESTHINDYERLSKLMALLAIAFSWAYAVGAIKNKTDKIRIKNHGRKSISIFRLGLDLLDEIFSHIESKSQQFKHVVRVLSCT